MASRRSERPPTPRLALSKAELAVSLGVSPDYISDWIWPELRLVRRGSKTFVAVTEVQRWLIESAARTIDP
jgi:hypothetical protein